MQVAPQHSNKSQTALILALFKERGELTNVELNRICFRYAARIHELRREGHKIVTVRESNTLRRFVYQGEEQA